MKNALREKSRRALLFVLLGVTRALSRLDLNLPTRWYMLLDTLRVSSGTAYARLSMIDGEVEEEVLEKERMIEDRLKRRKYTRDDIERYNRKKREAGL
ncbi:MAG: hypothetical protein ABEK01_02720 [Candidatus Nanohaloarchaea archaeon]